MTTALPSYTTSRDVTFEGLRSDLNETDARVLQLE